MDRLRGIAVLLVIIWHAFSIPTFYGVAMPARALLMNDALSSYRIPALLVLSGLLLSRSMAKPVGTYYWGKVRHIAWPFLMWSIIYLLANPDVDGRSPDFWLGGSYLWYLLVIGFCYAIGPLVRWVPAILIATTLIVGFTLLSGANNDLVYALMDAPYFFIGVAAVPLLPLILRAPGWIVAIGSAIAGTWAAYSAVQYGYAPRLHPLGFPISVLGVFCLAWGLNRVPRTRWLEWTGRHSLQFYVAHFPVMVIACRYGAAMFPQQALYPVLLILGIVAALLLSKYVADTVLFQFPDILRRREHGADRFARS